MIKVIFNADDFGFSRGVNEGILHCFKNGVISSASLFANMNSTKNAIDIIKKNNLKDIGVHLNITDGKGLAGRSTITDKKGNFIGGHRLFLRLFLKRVDFKDIMREFEAQINFIMNYKIKPSHLDTHMYIHAYQSISDICVNLAKKYGIKSIRNSYDSNILRCNFLNFQYLKLIFINKLSKNQKAFFLRNNIKTTDCFHGIMQMYCKNPLDYFIKTLKKLKEGTHEIMCHPGYPDEELMALSPYYPARKKELIALCSKNVKSIIKEKNIMVLGFNQL